MKTETIKYYLKILLSLIKLENKLSLIQALTTQERAQQQYGSIDNDKIDDKEENNKTDIFKIT